jgi:hypothetical protein
MSIDNDLLNLKEAGQLTGLSETTLRKYLGLGKPAKPSRLPNARKVSREGKDFWEIPVSDLFNAGLMKGKTNPRQFAGVVATAAEELELDLRAIALKAENEALKKQIALLERNLEDLREEIRFSRRAIETAEVQTRRRFWQRPN